MVWVVLKRWWWLSLLLGASACQASFDIVISVDEDGSGVVATTSTIDAEATAKLLDLEDDANGIVLADLAQSGWVVGRPEVAINGSTVITASKEFGTPQQFSEVMNELTGPDGPIRDFRLVRTKSFGQVDYELTGVIDSETDLSAFSDPDLESTMGRSLQAIAVRYGVAEEQISVSVLATLPGELEGPAPSQLIATTEDEVGARWLAGLADEGVETVELATVTRNFWPVVLVGVAVVAAVGAFLVVFAQVMRVLLPDRRLTRPKSRQPKVKARISAAPTGAKPHPETGPLRVIKVDGTMSSPYQVVALAAMGVLYREANYVEELLIPFVRESGARRFGDEEIVIRARSLSLGRITTHQFWQAVGVDGDPIQLDVEFMSRFQLTPGVIKYLRLLRESGVRVACITNLAASWATALKANHSLEGLIDPWVVSGSVGARKPDVAFFEVLRRVTRTPAAEIQVIDEDLTVLNAARGLGFGTAWLAPYGERTEANEHLLIRNFALPEEDQTKLDLS